MEVKEEEVIRILKKIKKPIPFSHIAKLLNLEKTERKKLKKVLKELRKKGKVGVEKNKFKLIEEEIVEGEVLAYTGFGFLKVEGREKDIYIPPFEMKKLFHGDRIKAKIVDFRGKKEIRVLKVIKRSKKELICSIKKSKKRCFGVPLDENAHIPVLLPPKDCKDIKKGSIAVVKITRYPTDKVPACGKIKEVLGHPSEKFLAVDIIIRKHNLPTDYPEEAIKEAEKLEINIEDEIKRRRDLRDQLCFTIDPEKAKDFDDAVAIERTPEGYFRLFVHIADVSYFVKPGTAIDREAYRRGFTFYFPDRALHMLPEKLASDLCSLVPGKDRLTFTCEMIYNEKGSLLHYDIYESVINSKARLTYDQALSIIVGDPAVEKHFSYLTEPLRNMEILYRILSKKRWEAGSIDFDLPESEVIIDEYGEPVAVVPYERHIAHRIIEHFMISANETVAQHLEKAGYPCLYRVHENPDPERVENLIEILNGLGYKVPKTGNYNSRFFQKIIEDFEGRPEENMIRFLTLRTMKRAKYSPHNLGHFGLALEHYAHFTSPIRRYSDIIVHRLLKSALRGEDIDYDKTIAYLEEAGEHLSTQERLAEETEREAIDLLKARYMKSRLGETFKGIITGVTSFGIFVEIEDILAEGLVHINTLKEDEYIYDEPSHRLVGLRTGKIYRLGDVVKVKVIGVDEERARIDLSLEN